MGLLSAVADVLEKIAEEAKAPRAPKDAPAIAVDQVKAASDRVLAATGKVPSREAARKVAEDKELLEIIDKVAAEKAKPTPMGGPSEEKVASRAPASDKLERIASAYDSWGAAVTRN